ncbi:hypothetical protein ACQPWR_12965 [Micromonospora vinacea]|uniref:hypothetical protein n=1 Tax=Micromonospora vinacea TaxID=709878 RepID=UPI003D946BC6
MPHEPLGGGHQRPLGVGVGVGQGHDEYAAVPVVRLGDHPGEPGGAYPRGEAGPAGGAAQPSLGEVGQERAEVLGAGGGTGCEGPHRRHAERALAVETVGPGQPAGEHREGRGVQLVEQCVHEVAERACHSGPVVHDRGRCRWQRVEGHP